MSRVICPNCGRAFQMQGTNAECPRCHYGAPTNPTPPAGFVQVPTQPSRPSVTASTFTLPPPQLLPPGATPPMYYRTQSTNGLAITSLVLGILGLVLPFLAPLALTFGVVGIVQTRGSKQPGGGMAIAGTVLGALVIVMWIVIIMALVDAFS